MYRLAAPPPGKLQTRAPREGGGPAQIPLTQRHGGSGEAVHKEGLELPLDKVRDPQGDACVS
jgi:hypothetical protein